MKRVFSKSDWKDADGASAKPKKENVKSKENAKVIKFLITNLEWFVSTSHS